MTLTKNGVKYEITDKTQIEAFLGSGWTPYEDGLEDKTDQEPGNGVTPKSTARKATKSKGD